MFLTHSSSECFLYLLYDLFCDEPISFCDNFLLQFSFSEISITSGLFLSKIKPYYNLLKCCSQFAIAIFVFLCICASWEINCMNKCQKLLFIGLSLYLIMSSNCSTFCISNFLLSVIYLQSRFCIPIYKLFVLSFPVLLLFQSLFIH